MGDGTVFLLGPALLLGMLWATDRGLKALAGWLFVGLCAVALWVLALGLMPGALDRLP